jgi:hypothetical protein
MELQKSVQPPAPSPSRVTPAMFAIGIGLVFSIVINLCLVSSWAQEKDWRVSNFEAWQDAERDKEDLARQLSDLRREIEDVTGNHWSYGLSTDAGREVWRACRKDPSGLVFAPKSLRWQIDDKIRFDNPTPIVNDAGLRFRPGETCRLASDTDLRIVRAADVFSIRLAAAGSYGASCPDGAYVNVSERNDVIAQAVSVGCLKKAKAFEIAFAAP